ncbi:HAD family hydrolase [Echinimonas agarilytica]|uniref:Beta-phosphoglucomutase family hydrolase n=1 Tax=Echinimonas agarilytica TaxID=1215918 RepID=A0AA42B600_9GAMM|nr:beta-phosphoglucomutase family hydrolase [Echinimonas agarilytica]MCM2678220.1 beta-phosphoglucomutase family hydrolase [Echinimonas agarilytica]
MNPILEQFDALIFDMDGTLIDSMPAHMDAWEQTAQHHGFPYDREWHHSLGGVPTRKTAEMIGQRYEIELDAAAVAETKRQKWEAMGAGPVLIDPTYAVFNQFHGQKKIAVGTGAERAHAEEMLEEVGILSRLDALVTASDVVNGKPSGDTFLKAANTVGVAPERCVVFEDTEIGRQAAEAAGMQCIMVVDGQICWPK